MAITLCSFIRFIRLFLFHVFFEIWVDWQFGLANFEKNNYFPIQFTFFLKLVQNFNISIRKFLRQKKKRFQHQNGCI